MDSRAPRRTKPLFSYNGKMLVIWLKFSVLVTDWGKGDQKEQQWSKNDSPGTVLWPLISYFMKERLFSWIMSIHNTPISRFRRQAYISRENVKDLSFFLLQFLVFKGLNDLHYVNVYNTAKKILHWK